MSIPLKHHFLPEFYQNGWAGADRKVTVFTRPRDRLIAKRRFPSETGYEQELYAVETRKDPAARQALELEVMSPVDNGAAQFLSHIRSRSGEPVDPAFGDAWATFIVSLLHRTPFMIQKLKAALQEREEPLLERVLAEYEKLRGPDDAKSVEQFLASDPTHIPEAFAKLLPMLIKSERVREGLRRMDWAIITLGDGAHQLMTSDSPLIMSNGIAYQNSFIILPVSPKEIFVGAHSTSVVEAFASQGAKALSLAMNDAVVRQARHFVIAADESQRRFVDNRLGRGECSNNEFGGISWACPVVDLPQGEPLF
jgi:hypothetical protein